MVDSNKSIKRLSLLLPAMGRIIQKFTVLIVSLVMEIVKTLNNHCSLFQSTDYSLGRICAEDVISQIQVPPFNNSAMDGYAICVDESFTAPFELDITAPTIGAGQYFEGQLNLGGFQSDTNDGLSGNIWAFSVTDDEVYKKLQQWSFWDVT